MALAVFLMPNPAEEKERNMHEKVPEGAIIYTGNLKVPVMPMILQGAVMGGLISIAAFFINQNQRGDITLLVL